MHKHTVILYYKSIDAVYITKCNGYQQLFLFDDDYDIYDDIVTSNYKKAINKLHKLLTPNTINLTTSKIYFNLGVLYGFIDDKHNMLLCFEKSSSFGNAYALASLGLHYAKNREYEKAEAYFDKGILTGSMHAICAKADYYRSLDSKDVLQKMFELYQSSIELGNVFAMYNLSSYYHNVKDYKNAEKYALMVYEIERGVGANCLGDIYDDENFSGFDQKKALEYYQIASEHNNLYAKLCLGILYYSEGNVDKAIKMYEEACYYGCSLSPFHLFKIYLDQNNEELAAKYAKISAYRDFDAPIWMISELYIKNKDYDKAKTFFTPKILGNNPLYYSYFSRVCYFLGKIQESIDNLKYGIELAKYENTIGLLSHDIFGISEQNDIATYKNKYAKNEKLIGILAQNISVISKQNGNIEDKNKYALMAMEHGNLKVCNILEDLDYIQLYNGFKLYAKYLDKYDCKCKYRGICKFECDISIKGELKNQYICLNNIISEFVIVNYPEHMDILLIVKKYLNPANLKIVNEYISTLDLQTNILTNTSINENNATSLNENNATSINLIECICCMEETTRMITLYCSHQVCCTCYQKLMKCPLCKFNI